MKLPLILTAALLAAATPAFAAEIHVAASGNDTADGSSARPLKTISAAAMKAMPGDTVTVHTGVYREWVKPPRGGESDTKRIVYRAAPGEKVTITGSERVTGWTRVQGDTWKTEIPNKRFGDFNPFAGTIYGDWFSPNGRAHHRGGVWIGDTALDEAAGLGPVMAKPGDTPQWFAKVDGIKTAPAHASLFNVASFKIGAGAVRRASAAAGRNGGQNAGCSEGGDCVGYIGAGHWLRHDGVDFGAGASSATFRVAAPAGAGGVIELRDGHFDGPLLGSGVVTPTGGWQNWTDLTVNIKRTSGVRSVYLVFKDTPKAPEVAGADAGAKTTIYAQFPGMDPNATGAEVAFRPTVFTPEKTGVDYITVRGFELCNAATNWAAPTAGQRGLVTAYWNKGWIIEDNDIHDSRCSGIALGKYSDEWDGKRGTTEGYALTIADALKTGGWSREKVGSHIVRRNHIHRCGQTGIVGGMGAAFSVIEGNDIHDIYWNRPFAGLEMACIKFHGAIDVTVRDNHLWRCGYTGLWLDWMTQGAQITGNLIHDCGFMVINMEVNHGPNLIANNILLGSSFQLCGSNGNAYAHNLGTWRMWPNALEDLRRTPFMKPHSTEFAGTHTTPATGDDHVFNNISVGVTDWRIYDGFDSPKGKIKPLMPSWLAGNVYLKGSTAPAREADALALPQHDAGLRLTQKSDGWHLAVSTDKAWKNAVKRRLVTTASLGKSAIAGVLLENPDGTPLAVDTDYFGKKRDAANPFPGPFETPVNGEVKVWPK